MDVCRDILLRGLAALKLELTETKIQQLLEFIQLIEKWNKAYNLTAIRNREDMVSFHLLDSLVIVPFIHGKRVIDVGTGAGLPGIPLAIAQSDCAFTLLDSNAKKTRFVQQAVLELRLRNVAVLHQRVENYRPEIAYDAIVTRAFSNLADMVQLTGHLLHKDGEFLAMKGKILEQEMAQVLKKQVTAIPVHVPGVDAERCLIKITSLTETEVR